MIAGPLKNQIDKLWEELWTGGITNPLTAIDQISLLLFARLLDIAEVRRAKSAGKTKRQSSPLFGPRQQHLRWGSLKKEPADRMLAIARDELFPHLRALALGTPIAASMTGAELVIQKPSLLASAVRTIDALPLAGGDAAGDLYEHLLSKLSTAGINGQFRTPRHIVRFMIDLVDPQPTEVIGDPACGTGGFLVGVMQHLLERHSSEAGTLRGEDGEAIYTGDKLDPYRRHIQRGMLHGFDIDSTMLRIASMNLTLHGIESPAIHYQDTLSASFSDRFPALATGGFDVILANPPFKGSLDAEDVDPTLTGALKTKRTELLFGTLVLRMLKPGGRSATIVPEGVLFGSSKAPAALRRLLIEENGLQAVISLPAGVFRPYAGVSTAVLVFTKGGRTDHVLFYDVKADGYSLDDKRERTRADDLPDALARFRGRRASTGSDRASKAFTVSAAEILDNGLDLSINRYRKPIYTELRHESPKDILSDLRRREQVIARGLAELDAMLSNSAPDLEDRTGRRERDGVVARVDEPELERPPLEYL
jgi:type I restriction enzyme M protein